MNLYSSTHHSTPLPPPIPNLQNTSDSKATTDSTGCKVPFTLLSDLPPATCPWNTLETRKSPSHKRRNWRRIAAPFSGGRGNSVMCSDPEKPPHLSFCDSPYRMYSIQITSHEHVNPKWQNWRNYETWSWPLIRETCLLKLMLICIFLKNFAKCCTFLYN